MAVDRPEVRSGSFSGKTVYLHVGAPKTGTSYLQARLTANAAEVAGQGMLWPLPWDRQVRAARNVKTLREGSSFAPDEPWSAIVEEIRAWPGPAALVSMEWLVNAEPHQVDAVFESLEPARVEVVCTARDIVSALPAKWQESMQNSRTWGWGEFVQAVAGRAEEPHPGAVEFWAQHDVLGALERWSRPTSAERVHLVTVPLRSQERGLLWERFCSVVGLDGHDFREPSRSNPSLGVVSAQLMRRVNVAARERQLPRPTYHRFLKHQLAKEILAERRGAEGPIGVPQDVYRHLVERAASLVAELADAPFPVVGDLDDLVPAEWTAGRDPDEVPPGEMLEAAVDGLVRLVESAAEREGSLRRELERAEQRLQEATGTSPARDRVRTLVRRVRVRLRRGAGR